MPNIRYDRLTEYHLHEHSLDGFVRHQVVTESWRRVDGEWQLISTPYVEDWSAEKRRELAAELRLHLRTDCAGYGAFDGDALAGFCLFSREFFGSANQYVQLEILQVSEPYRRNGIGKQLFLLTADLAREHGAKKLYISAHSSKESQAAYRKLGCILAKEINLTIVAAEPYDVPLEYIL